VALAEALAAGPKPSMWSRSMWKLYMIMGGCYFRRVFAVSQSDIG
jgi:hypothetical protein